MRRKRLRACLACLFAAIPACHTARSHRPLPAGNGIELEVMSFNIRYGTAKDGENRWEKRREHAFDVIRAYRPDVAGLQEALRFQIDELKAALPGYGEIGVGRDDGMFKGEYAVILYRTDRFDVSDQGTFWFSDSPEVPGSKSWGNRFPRICTWARLIDKASGHGLYVYNVHLDHESQASRERSVRLLVERLRKRAYADPFVLTGDFNADECNPAIRYLTRDQAGALKVTPSNRNTSLVDTYRVLYPDTENVQTFNGFGTKTNRGKIDYVYAPKSAKVLEAEIVREQRNGRYPSDHFPVVARVRLAAY